MDLKQYDNKKITSIVKELVNRRCKKMQQEFAGENEEVMDRLLRQFQAKISRCSWKASQKWCRWNNEGPVLMPDYTRLYYRKGKTEVLVQEWPPQIRLTKFRASLLREDTSAAMADGTMDKTHSFSLAFPYVVFIYRFRDGKFADVRCAFSDRPLKRLEEKPLRPYLSNLDSNLQVCLGRSFDHNKLEVGNIVQQAAYITSYFWQSVYSDEWSQHFWNSKRHFMGCDPRMASLDAWQDASSENPLFVVEDVNWLPHNEESFGDIVVKLFDDDRVAAEMGQELYQEFIDEFMSELKTTMNNNINSVATRVGSIDDSQLKQEVNSIINSVGE